MSFGDNAHNVPPHPFTSNLQFQIPSFVCSSAPTLAPGGGAEVLPVSLLSDNSLAHSWFSNNGFTPRLFIDQYPQNEQPSQDSARASQSYGQQQQQSHHNHSSASAPFDFDSQITPLNAQSQAPPPLPPSYPSCSLPSLSSPRTLTQAELSTFIQPQQALPSHLIPPPNFPIHSPLGIYSTSGFDLLSILARVSNRPNPRVTLGPVDMTCSFVVVDVRRFDHPIVYCSPNFCQLTGYSENEVLGRNCRFLQAPNGQVVRGESRRYTDQSAVVHLKKNLGADKECQTSIINYKKGGTAFMNLVTVIPILGGVSGALHEEAEVVYHIGFQVDLTEQPNLILEKLRNGSYTVDRNSQQLAQLSSSSSSSSSPFGAVSTLFDLGGGSGYPKDRKLALPSIRMSRDLKKLLADPAFIKSIPITTSTTVCTSQPSSSSSTRVESDTSSLSASAANQNQLLHLMLLEASPDFILVVSLKGKFLYVAPSVRRVLGYEPDELVEQSISDYAHAEDVVPLMRELKEGSATGLAAATASTSMVDGSGSGAGADGSSSLPTVSVAAAAAAGVAGGGLLVPSADQTQVLHPVGMQMVPRTVDLLFRMRTKVGVYVWIECKGRLHLEPGKGRKAIILSARAKEMPSLGWHLVAQNGLGMPTTVFDESSVGGAGERGLREVQTEVWGMMSAGRCGEAVSFVVVGAFIADILGWSPSELIGRQLSQFLVVDGSKGVLDDIRPLGGEAGGISSPRRIFCKLRHKNGSAVDVLFVLFPPDHDPLLVRSIKGVIPAPLICQIRLVQSLESSQPSTSLAHPLTTNVFEPLDMNRDSSWQYESQQIRFANQRLVDECATLEKQLKDLKDMRLRVVSDVSPQLNAHETPDHYAAQTNQHPHHRSPHQVDQASTSQQQHHLNQPHHRQQHYIINPEQTPRLQNLSLPSTVLRSLPHYPSMGQGPFLCSPQPQRALPAIPISHEWDHTSFMQHPPIQSHLRLPGSLKRSWDMATNQ